MSKNMGKISCGDSASNRQKSNETVARLMAKLNLALRDGQVEIAESYYERLVRTGVFDGLSERGKDRAEFLNYSISLAIENYDALGASLGVYELAVLLSKEGVTAK